MRIKLTFGHSEKRSTNVNAGQCINMFPAVNDPSSKNLLTLSSTPGLEPWVLTKIGEVRGLYRINDVIYSVTGDTLYSIPILSPNSKASVGSLDTSGGKVWMENNANNQLMICDGSKGWVYESGSLSQVSDADFPGCSSLSFIDQYGVVTEPASGRLWNSDLNDFTAWTATSFATAEGSPDNLLGHIADHREAWLFGEDTIEVFKNTGDADAVFQRIQGTFQEVGINAPRSLAKEDNSVFFLDDNLQVRMTRGFNLVIISTPAISYRISQLATTSDALGMTYVQDGHAYYVITFPTSELTLVYDIWESQKAGFPLWHERRSFPIISQSRWRGNAVIDYDGEIYVGDYENGYIYKMKRDVYQENGEIIKRIFTTQEVYDPDYRREIFHEELELEVESGVGLQGSVQGSDPEVVMQYSDDGGHTWSNESPRSIGKIGEYRERVRWQMLGSSRNRIYRFYLTDPVNFEVVSGYLYASMGTD